MYGNQVRKARGFAGQNGLKIKGCPLAPEATVKEYLIVQSEERVDYMLKKEELIELIKDAFKDIPYPGDDSIGSDHCWECQHVADTLRGKRSDEITLEFLIKDLRESVSICLLSCEAFQYYLPALLLLIIENQGQEKIGNWEDRVISILWPDEPGSQYYDFTVEKYKIFNNQQKHVIRLFLEYLICVNPNEHGYEDSPPKEALKNYWNQW
ncbi:MAG: DUF6714 family protein [Anaerohalosphaeraceae bacterium]